MILLLARNDVAEKALDQLEAEGMDRRDVLVRNPKYEGVDPRDLKSWQGETFEQVVWPESEARKDELREQCEAEDLEWRELGAAPKKKAKAKTTRKKKA